MKKSIIFDFDGVIADSNRLKINLLCNIFSETFNYSKIKIKNLMFNSELGLNRASYIEKLEKLLRKKIDEEKLLKLIHTKIQKRLITAKLNPYLKKMREYNNDIDWFIITSGNEEEVRRYLKKYKINHYFKEILGGYGNKYLSFLSLSKKYQIKRKNLVVIGDGNRDLKLIKKLSCYGLIVLKWSLEKKNLKYLKIPKVEIINNFRALNFSYKNIIKN